MIDQNGSSFGSERATLRLNFASFLAVAWRISPIFEFLDVCLECLTIMNLMVLLVADELPPTLSIATTPTTIHINPQRTPAVTDDHPLFYFINEIANRQAG